MNRFLDSSALVKRYVAESDSEAVRRVVVRGQIAVVRIAYAEVAAALSRAVREDAITARMRERAMELLDDDFDAFNVVEVRPALMRLCAELTGRHPLRGYDAVQLAAALTLRGSFPLELWSADTVLCQAARAEGVRVRQVSGS